MAERASPSAKAAASAKRPPPVRAEKRGGWWHRPALLNLISGALLVFAVLGLVSALVSWALAKPLFPLRELVLLTPPEKVTQAQLEHTARKEIRGNFFTARIDDVRRSFEKLPWVRHAEVRRIWPDALALRLEEHEAVAYWRDIGDSGGDVRLIDRQGDVFVASSDAVMPEFSGPQGMASAMLERYGTYSEILRPLRVEIVRMDLSASGTWHLWLDDGLSIVIDRDQERSPQDARLKDFVTAWLRLRNSVGGRIARADLRYPNGFALIPNDYKTLPQPAAHTAR